MMHLNLVKYALESLVMCVCIKMYSIFEKQKETEEKIEYPCFPDPSISTSGSDQPGLKRP